MKRNAANDDELISSHKKLKFGVDTILGGINSDSDHDFDDQLRQKGKIWKASFSSAI